MCRRRRSETAQPPQPPCAGRNANEHSLTTDGPTDDRRPRRARPVSAASPTTLRDTGDMTPRCHSQRLQHIHLLLGSGLVFPLFPRPLVQYSTLPGGSKIPHWTNEKCSNDNLALNIQTRVSVPFEKTKIISLKSFRIAAASVPHK